MRLKLFRIQFPIVLPTVLLLGSIIACSPQNLDVQADPAFLSYEASEGAGQGKHIVLISGDEEYRSEEALPMLARILSEKHGFRCTVLFAVEPETGIVNPHANTNIPGLSNLDDADLMVIFTRWRVLPEEQMAHVDRFLMAGKPVIALRTATHAFAPTKELHRQVLGYLRESRRAEDPSTVALPDIATDAWAPYDHYGDGYTGPKEAWRDGFGRLVVGERWVAHHGHHKHESTVGVVAPDAVDHPILRGVREGDIWASSDVYTVRLPLPGDSMPLVLGKVMKRTGDYNEEDVHYGMRPDDAIPVDEKNDPMMPVAWIKSYQVPGGELGRVFATTMGASSDLLSDGLRQMLLNSVYWTLGMEDVVSDQGVDADIVGDYQPHRFHNHPPEYWQERAMRPIDFQ